ncbi:MAG: hypothetical protein A2Y86_02805 [Candidatus Aminicenantes bacterium RBG_13_62_12]|nr:MAG: hypothetical protein A2Y86_02805 [Candidatus Aminicenantes bacterium RBG_13_62_12]
MNVRPGIWLIVLFLAAAPGLWGAEESAGHGGGSLDFIGKVINFAVLFGGLAFVLFKPLRAMLRKRTEDVRRTLDDSEAERRRAEENLRFAQARLENLASEVEALRKAAEAEGLAEQEKIRRLAAEEAEKIKRLTKSDMEAQVRAGIRELKRHAAGLAVERASARLKSRLTPERQAGLIDLSIAELAGKDEKEGSDPKIRPRAH